MVVMPDNHPNTHHEDDKPYWYSDSKKGIRTARRATPRGYRCFKDMNLQPCLDDDVFAHWSTTHENDLFFIQVSRFRRRAFPNLELETLPAETIKRLRHTKRRGLSYRSRCRPLLYNEGIIYCRMFDVIPCVELKNKLYAQFSRTYHLVRSGVLFMALYKMGHCLEKGRAVISSGGQFAILAHGEPRPSNLEKGVNYTQIWGHFSG